MSKDLFYSQLLEQEQELIEALDAIRKLKKHYNKDESSQKTIPFKEAEHNTTVALNKYDKDWIIKDKVLYVLKSLSKGTVIEVANKLVNYDEDFSYKKAHRVATHYLSQSYRNNIIGATKVGNKFRYYIKDN